MESSLGNSLKVPIVQELAKEKLSSVPSRYVRPNHEHHHTPPSSLPQIPIIDLNALFDPNFMDSQLEKLHSACKDWGFFQLINHGVKSCVIDAMKLEIQEFFNLPIEEKKKLCQEAGEVEGYGQIFVVSQDQKLDWADLFYVTTLPTSLRKPHLIPKLPSQFRDAVEAYAQELKDVAMKILKMMEKALGMKCEEIERLFEEGMQSMRMNYYPPQRRTQCGDMGILSNGTYRSIEHRATVNAEKERISVATFLGPNKDYEIGPSPSLVSPENPAKFNRISYADYVRGLFSKELDGKSHLDSMRV